MSFGDPGACGWHRAGRGGCRSLGPGVVANPQWRQMGSRARPGSHSSARNPTQLAPLGACSRPGRGERLRKWSGNEPSSEATPAGPGRPLLGGSSGRSASADPHLGDGVMVRTANPGLAVATVHPAHTSRWGEQHWLAHCNRSRPLRAATMRRHSGSGAADSATEHGDGEGVTRLHRRMGKSELPTLPGRPCRHPPACPSPQSGNRGTPGQRAAPAVAQTQPADRSTLGHQADQDRSGPPAGQCSVSLRVQERMAGGPSHARRDARSGVFPRPSRLLPNYTGVNPCGPQPILDR